MATADLFRKIICYTDAHCDNDHIHILIDNNTEIPDRTSHIIGGGEDPLPMLVDSALRLEVLGAQLIVMPCNTAHYYYQRIKQFLHVPFLNMIEETAAAIKTARPPIERVGLLATPGTYAAGIYEEVFQRFGITVVQPDEAQQAVVNDVIYGVKSGNEPDGDGFRTVLRQLKAKDVQAFVLGCTELPIAWEALKLQEFAIDPTAILAKSTIRAVGKKVKGEA